MCYKSQFTTQSNYSGNGICVNDTMCSTEQLLYRKRTVLHKATADVTLKHYKISNTSTL